MSSFAQNEIERRLANIAQMGVVEEVDYSNPPTARVRIGDFLTGPLRMASRRVGDAVESWAYSVGEEVLVIATSGDLSQGVIVCALPNGANPAHAVAQNYKISFPGGLILEVKDGAFNFTGDINIVGQVSVNGDVIADGISLKNHTHGGVAAGLANTEAPS